jgi:hypothetical protein
MRRNAVQVQVSIPLAVPHAKLSILLRQYPDQENEGKENMSKIDLNTPAPDFQLADLNGNLFRLSDQISKANVLLVFNRGFV